MKRLMAFALVASVIPLAAWRIADASVVQVAERTAPVPAAAALCAPAPTTTTMVPEEPTTTTTTTTLPAETTTTTTEPPPPPCPPPPTEAPTTSAPPAVTPPPGPAPTTPATPSTTTSPTTPTTAPPAPGATTATTTTTTAPAGAPVVPGATTTTIPGATPGGPTPTPSPGQPGTTAPGVPAAPAPDAPDASTGGATTPPPTAPPSEPPSTTTPPTKIQEEDPTTQPVTPPAAAPSGRVVVAAGSVDDGQVRPITFPVAGPVSYWNDFGACRDGCKRAHKGNDLIGDRLQPLLAMSDGVVDHLIDHRTAGFGIAIRDDEGWQYHIYHVNNDSPDTDDGLDDGTWRFAPGIVDGARVRAGQLIGWMGDSGNSEGSVPHAHVEIHTPTGTAINPFWSLRLAQRDVNCAIEEVAALAPAEPDWWTTGWSETVLPGVWRPLALTARSDSVRARMWIGPNGFIPVDAASLRAGDPRFDVGVDCDAPSEIEVPSAVPAELSAILATIRTLESGNNYTAQSSTSTASGAYQFLDSSWGRYGGYARAKDAPPAVQDAAATELARKILAANNGDVSTVPVSWYIGHVPRPDEWDVIPPYPGNRLTPRQYQSKWMQIYAGLAGTAPPAPGAGAGRWTAVDTTVCRTAVVDLGRPDASQYVMTQVSAYAADSEGRAVVAPPATGAAATPDPAATLAAIPGVGAIAPSVAPATNDAGAPAAALTGDADAAVEVPVDPCDPSRPAPGPPPPPPPATIPLRGAF